MKVNEEIEPTDDGATFQKATARPWQWRSFGSGLMLSNHRAHIVMDFVRRGMRGAEPRFGKRTDNMGGLMVPLSEWESLPPDAEFIVEAVNSHDALCAALLGLRRNARCWCSTWVGGEHEPECEAARAALKVVDGTPAEETRN